MHHRTLECRCIVNLVGWYLPHCTLIELSSSLVTVAFTAAVRKLRFIATMMLIYSLIGDLLGVVYLPVNQYNVSIFYSSFSLLFDKLSCTDACTNNVNLIERDIEHDSESI